MMDVYTEKIAAAGKNKQTNPLMLKFSPGGLVFYLGLNSLVFKCKCKSEVQYTKQYLLLLNNV